MSELYLKILNMSIAASYLVIAVILLRLLLRKAPRWTFVLLWGIVALRLLCPFSIESSISLIPDADPIPDAVISDPNFNILTDIPAVEDIVQGVYGDPIIKPGQEPSLHGGTVVTIFSVIWLVGMLIMAVYALLSYWRVRKNVATAVRLRNHIFVSEKVVSPFILGVIRPKIYLPYSLDDVQTSHILSHEQAHIRRKDHWWKPLGFLLLSVHWFNPLMWIAYLLLSRDIEQACDEKVIRSLETQQRADYSETLLKCSISRNAIAACPLAFGEVGVKERVKNVLSYKKPAFWVILVSVLACTIVAACFLTDPVNADGNMWVPQQYNESPVMWFDKYATDSPNFGEQQLDAFPGVTFRWDYRPHVIDSSERLVAVKKGKETALFPVGATTSVYVADVTGDGKPDICANVYHFFSGFPSYNAVQVYDYANDKYYTLADRDNTNHDTKVSYYLRLRDGELVCDKIHEATNQVLASGTLDFVNAEIEQQLYLQPRVTYPSPVKYEFHGENYWWDFVSLIVCNDGSGKMMFNPRLNADGSSNRAEGICVHEEDRLVFTTEDGRTFVFRFDGDDLVFLAEHSDALPSGCSLYDGAVLEARPYFP